MVGDGKLDIGAAINAGCIPILVNGPGSDSKDEDFGQKDTVSSLGEFVEKYL